MDQQGSRNDGANAGQAVNVTIPVYVGGKHLSTVVLDDVNQTEKKGRDPVTATA